MEPKRLYRSSTRRVIGGVAGGLADYFEIDVVITRIIFLALALLGGGGVLIYVILWIILPEDGFSKTKREFYEATTPDREFTTQPETNMNETSNRQNDRSDRDDESKTKGAIIAGVVLITLGALFFIDNLIPSIDFGDLWPIFLIVLGLVLLFTGMPGTRRRNNPKND